MVDSVTARTMLGVGRSTLYRYVHRRLLREKQVRLVTPRGTRVKAYYLRAEVAKLAARMRAIRARQQELTRLLLLREQTAAGEWPEDPVLSAAEESRAAAPAASPAPKPKASCPKKKARKQAES